MSDQIIAERYLLQDDIGAGGMGTVFRALDSQTNTIVAVKELKSEVAQPEIIERFKREGEALRDLNHPNIVKMIDAVEHDGYHYLVQPGGNGTTVYKMWQEKGLKEARNHHANSKSVLFSVFDPANESGTSWPWWIASII